MNSQRSKAKRVIRDLTPEESRRLAIARQEVEANRDQILREGRVAKRSWMAMRRDVEEAVGGLRVER